MQYGDTCRRLISASIYVDRDARLLVSQRLPVVLPSRSSSDPPCCSVYSSGSNTGTCSEGTDRATATTFDVVVEGHNYGIIDNTPVKLGAVDLVGPARVRRVPVGCGRGLPARLVHPPHEGLRLRGSRRQEGTEGRAPCQRLVPSTRPNVRLSFSSPPLVSLPVTLAVSL
jgi:hypothetical protein